jgi:hydrogenase-4 component E
MPMIASHGLSFDIAHTLAGLLVLVSLMMLYQVRLLALLHVLGLHAFVLALSVAWQAHIQDAPHLYITAAIALGFKAMLIPYALRRMVFQMGLHRDIETVGGVGMTMLAGIALALSVVLIGLLMMVTRRNAISQVVGFMSLENGINLAATGARGMPLVVEISVAFSVLIAFIVIGIFLFRIRERFDTIDVSALDRSRGGQF